MNWLMKRTIYIIVTLVVLLSSTMVFIVLSGPPDRHEYRETTLDVQVIVTVKNQGNAPASTIPLVLALPMDGGPDQYIERMDIPESENRTTNDTWGNRFVHYTIDWLEPQSTREFIFNYTLKLMSVDYNIIGKSIRDYPDQENLSHYLEANAFINYKEPNIVDLARQIANDSGDIVDIAWNSYKWIIDNIYYQQVVGEWDASLTLRNGEGASAELSNLFVALMRANDIPARRVSGWGNHFEKGEELYLTRFAHGWAEFYLPEFGWVPVDPAWGKSHTFDNFAKTDDEHVIMTRGVDNHFLQRGNYIVPHGKTDIDTDYLIIVQDISEENLSIERDIITAVIFGCPVFFAIFVVVKKVRERRI